MQTLNHEMDYTVLLILSNLPLTALSHITFSCTCEALTIFHFCLIGEIKSTFKLYLQAYCIPATAARKPTFLHK